MKSIDRLIVYTDGSALKNGAANNEGGFGVVVCLGDPKDEPDSYKLVDCHAERHTNITNNRMELAAVLWAMKNCGEALIRSDSQYVVRSITEWLPGWKKNGWKRAGNKSIENLDIMREFDKIMQERHIEIEYVKGHDKDRWNDLADRLATGNISCEEAIKEI